jgi:hypothetical protein
MYKYTDTTNPEDFAFIERTVDVFLQSEFCIKEMGKWMDTNQFVIALTAFWQKIGEIPPTGNMRRPDIIKEYLKYYFNVKTFDHSKKDNIKVAGPWAFENRLIDVIVNVNVVSWPQ